MNLQKVLLLAGLSVILLFSDCTDNSTDNTKRILSIDKMKTIDTVYEIQIDSTGVIIDTLSMHRSKINSKGVKVFAELHTLDNHSRKIILKKYMRDNGGLFYSINEHRTIYDTLISTHENWMLNGRIHKAISIFREPKKVDTIHMTYKYEDGNDGKLKKMTIFESGGLPIVETYYNQEEKPELDFFLYEGDTTQQKIYTYKGGKLISEKTLNKSTGTETINTYGAKDFLTSSKECFKDSLISKKVYRKDNKGNILVTIIK